MKRVLLLIGQIFGYACITTGIAMTLFILTTLFEN